MNKILSSASSCELLIENDFFNDLGEIMEDPKYKTFLINIFLQVSILSPRYFTCNCIDKFKLNTKKIRVLM